ncbi:MAG: hypothetical protein Ct9H300mP10_09990 [Methanobacteriota archaeon]|nr:MAG: hypothetical protein Ct9H300mP10_09990 [Euryarchaeota archaeon]
MQQDLIEGDMVLVDLGSLTHMPSQQEVCKRRVQERGPIISATPCSL